MKISLITACYNSVATIRTAIDSVFAQRGVDIEYIVVDGGSTDGTVDVIKEYAAKVGPPACPAHLKDSAPLRLCVKNRLLAFRWISEPDRGMYDAINKGIAMATGDVVGILNADDVLAADDTLAHVAAAFGERGMGDGEQENNSHPETLQSRSDLLCNVSEEGRIDCVYADICFVKEGASVAAMRFARTVRYYSAKRWKPWMLQWGKMPPHPSVYIRRELFEKHGLYKLGYDIAADYELLIRYLRMANLNTRYLNECVVRMRMGGKSTRGWRSNLKLNQEIVRGNRENGYFCCLPMLLPKYFFKIFEFILPKLRLR